MVIKQQPNSKANLQIVQLPVDRYRAIFESKMQKVESARRQRETADANAKRSAEFSDAKPAPETRRARKPEPPSLATLIQEGRKDELVTYIWNDPGKDVLHLEGADLTFVNLSDVDLSYCQLNRAYLFSSAFRGADFSNANLKSAYLYEAAFRSADFSHANMVNAKAWNSSFYRANFFDAQLSRAVFYGATLSQARLQDARLVGTRLDSARLIRANLSGANLTNANLIDADMTGAILWNACFDGAILNGARFPAAYEYLLSRAQRAQVVWVD
jgi:hypothetical protein